MKIARVLVSSMGRPRQEDKMPFDPCLSGFGSGIWQVTIAEKGEEENVLSLGILHSRCMRDFLLL